MRGEIIGIPLYAKGDIVSGAELSAARNLVHRTLTKYLRSRGHSWDPNLAGYPVSVEIDADGEMQRNVFPLGGMSREFDRLNRDVDGTGEFDAVYAMIMDQREGILFQRGREPATQVGRHHRRGGGGRRRYGGWGGGWGDGDAYIVDEVVYDPDLIMRTPVGTEFRPTGRAGNPNASAALIELLPILAPGSRGVSATFSMGPDQILHADICIDGRCYKRSLDVGQTFDLIARRIAAAHAQLHAAEGSAPSPAVANGAALHDTVQTAGELLMGAAYDEHCLTISAGWWHNMVGHRLMCLGRGAAHTLKALKAPITVAATAAAVAFVGPQAGPVAGQLTGALIDAANGDASAQQLVAAAQSAAQANPDVANALGAAQKAVAQTTAGYHIVKTVADAAQGDPAAAKQVQDLHTAAASGDSAAQQAVALVQNMASSGDAAPADGGDTQVSGALPLLALAAALGGGGGYLLYRERQKEQLVKLANAEIARMNAMTAAMALPPGPARNAAATTAAATTTVPPISAGC